MQIEAHDARHQPEVDLQDKGLSHDALGLLGGTVLGISSVAPAYALTATIGILVAEAGEKMPVVIIAGFLPMFFAAYAYRELNKVAPDCGTSFTWTTKAFGPYVGWLGGWAAVLATVIVLSNLAGVAVQFFYQFIGDLTGSDYIGTLWENKLINVITCLVFLAIATAVSYRGITTTEHVQFILVGFQMVVLVSVRRNGAGEIRLLGDRHVVQPRLVQPRRPDDVGVHRGSVRFDLRVLGLGHRPHGQRGVQRLRKDPRPGRAAVRAVDPADLPTGRRRDPDVRRSRHRGARPGKRGDLRQRLRRSRRTRNGQPAQPVPVPCRGGLERRQPHHHIPAEPREPCWRWAPTRPSRSASPRSTPGT